MGLWLRLFRALFQTFLWWSWRILVTLFGLIINYRLRVNDHFFFNSKLEFFWCLLLLHGNRSWDFCLLESAIHAAIYGGGFRFHHVVIVRPRDLKSLFEMFCQIKFYTLLGLLMRFLERSFFAIASSTTFLHLPLIFHLLLALSFWLWNKVAMSLPRQRRFKAERG